MMQPLGSTGPPLHYGHVPKWLAERMAKLGLAITESILTEYGKEAMQSPRRHIAYFIAPPYYFFQPVIVEVGNVWGS